MREAKIANIWINSWTIDDGSAISWDMEYVRSMMGLFYCTWLFDYQRLGMRFGQQNVIGVYNLGEFTGFEWINWCLDSGAVCMTKLISNGKFNNILQHL